MKRVHENIHWIDLWRFGFVAWLDSWSRRVAARDPGGNKAWLGCARLVAFIKSTANHNIHSRRCRFFSSPRSRLHPLLAYTSTPQTQASCTDHEATNSSRMIS